MSQDIQEEQIAMEDTMIERMEVITITMEVDQSKESLTLEIERSLEFLSSREAEIIRHYYGLNGRQAMTLEEIGEKFDLTRERVRQIKEKAIRRLKHTSRSKILKTYLG